MNLIAKKYKAFTIIELIVVITVVAILATLVVVAYGAVVNNAKIASIQTDLSSSAKLLRIYKIQNGSYPTALDNKNCPSAPVSDTNSCLKLSGSNGLYSYIGTSGSFTLKINNGSIAYQITDSGSVGSATLPSSTTFIKAYGLGSNVDDYISYAVQTLDGGIITAGGTGSTNLDASVTKYDSLGNVVWSKKWGGSSDEYLYKVIQTSDGGYAAVGYTYSTGAGDVLILKYDSSGNLLWVKTWGSASADEGYSIVQATDNGLVITGLVGGGFGSSTSDSFLLKLNSAGSLVWQKQWGLSATVSGADDGECISLTSDGGFIVTGETGSVADFDVHVDKFDSSGNLTWARMYRTAASQTSFGIVQTSDGGYALTGGTDWLGSASSDVTITKLDSTGNTVTWSKSWGGSLEDRGYGLVQMSDSGYVVTGYTNSNTTGQDLFLLKLDTTGAQSWARTWGGPSTEQGYYITRTNSDNIFVAGYSNGFGVGSYDSILLKYNSSGNITNCNTSTMCTTPSYTLSDLALTVQTPTISSSTPTYTLNSSPTGTGSDYNLSVTTIVSP